MDRREFLRILAGAAPVALVAPTYFFAPRSGWIAIGDEYLHAGWNFEETMPESRIGELQDYYRIPWEKYPRVFGERRISGSLRFVDESHFDLTQFNSRCILKDSDDA